MAQIKVPYRGMCPKDVRPKVWKSVVEAWQNGLSDREAAFFASKDSDIAIKESDIKRWMKENPDIAELKDHLQTELLSISKLNVREAIENGDIRTSKWYLERKAAEEFSTKSAVAFEGAVVDLTIEEKERRMKEFMKQFGVQDGE